jgi:hypothetical protein
VVTNRACYVPMSVFTNAPYGLPLDALIEVQVAAINANGMSAYSTVNVAGATAKSVPTTAPTLSRGAGTSDTQVVLTWTGLSASSDTGKSHFSHICRIFVDYELQALLRQRRRRRDNIHLPRIDRRSHFIHLELRCRWHFSRSSLQILDPCFKRLRRWNCTPSRSFCLLNASSCRP